LPAIDSQWKKPSAHFKLMAALSLILLFGPLHRGDLSGYDDAAYAHEARRALTTGEWMDLRLNGKLDFDKPPLFIWLEAISMMAFGANDFAAKFPAAVFGFGSILLIYILTRDLTNNDWLAVIAMLAVMSAQYFIKYATHAMTCVPFTFFFTLAMWAYVRAARNPRFYLLCGAAIGAANWTRSPVGLIPIGVFGVHLFLTGQFRTACRGYLASGLTLGLAISLSWFVIQYARHGDYFLRAHFSNLAAHTSAGESLTIPQRLLGFSEYFFLLCKLYWPWLPLMLVGFGMQAKKAIRQRDSNAIFLISWVVCVIAPFSLAESRVLRYILPAFPAFSILSAIALDRLVNATRRSHFLKLAYLVLFAVISVTMLSPGHRLRARDMRTLAPIAEAHTHPSAQVLLYTFGRNGWDYRNQLIWYSNRLADLRTKLDDLADALMNCHPNTVIIADRDAFTALCDQFPAALEVLGRSEQFVCFRKAGAAYANYRSSPSSSGHSQITQ
jgi:4-amino-4-deoxy-L-arabinose transferase-like glycosyltransferase